MCVELGISVWMCQAYWRLCLIKAPLLLLLRITLRNGIRRKTDPRLDLFFGLKATAENDEKF